MTERTPRGRNSKSAANKSAANKSADNKSAENKPAGKQPAAAAVDLPWSVPVVAAEVPETGRHVEFAVRGLDVCHEAVHEFGKVRRTGIGIAAVRQMRI